ncbi:glycerophosphodiester phosphodiesterase family protein [Vitreimonas flagellata]|uniref:glycerophosphodiester phosphodiesterase family protein n=1 Tax=Vitreimonas flagellata TaxID=2560861 RepID=UPI00107561A7|nr:glycerophosphodiester phosphodiesterase family protein [Vitreimonas flagellata]
MKRLLLIGALALAACDAPTSPATDVTPSAVEALAPADIGAFFDCLRDSGRTIVAAHRGGPSPGFAENAIPTFENIVRQAPALLEIDIARTRDNVLVLMHDDDLDRTTTGTGLVRDHTLAEIQALQLEDENGQPLDARVPTLREALDWADGRAILELDVKRGVSYEDVVAEVRAAGAEDRVVFITYSDDAAVRVHNLAPELMLSVSIDDARDLDTLERRGVDLNKVLAWTGTEEPNSALNIALAQRGVEAMFGTLGNPERSWDGRFEREGQDQYAAFAETGLQLIATDRPIEASRDLDTNDGVDGLAAMQCATTN